jgi:hypothetical protein
MPKLLLHRANIVVRALAVVQVAVLDGNKYTTMCREAGQQCLEILEECKVRLPLGNIFHPYTLSVVCAGGASQELSWVAS